MHKISDFNTVFEVALGLNAVFYIYSLVPYMEDQLRRLQQEHDALLKEKIEVTKNTEAFPIGFVVSCTYPFHKMVLTKATVFTFALIVSVLIYAGFYPDANMSTLTAWLVLGVGFGVPLIAFRIHSRTLRMIRAANGMLRDQIREAQREKWRNERKELMAKFQVQTPAPDGQVG